MTEKEKEKEALKKAIRLMACCLCFVDLCNVKARYPVLKAYNDLIRHLIASTDRDGLAITSEDQ